MAMMNPYNYKKPIGVNVNNIVNSAKSMDLNPAPLAKTKSDAYLEQKVMNARPEELTMMLYDGLVKFIHQAILFNEQKSFDKSNNANIRAQAILQELRSTLNMEVDLSAGLEDLYLFMIDHLVNANIEKNNQNLKEVLELATDLRDTWKEAMGL